MRLSGVVEVSSIVGKVRGGDEEKGEKKERIMEGKEGGHASEGKEGSRGTSRLCTKH
jgi:hypothetical protein